MKKLLFLCAILPTKQFTMYYNVKMQSFIRMSVYDSFQVGPISNQKVFCNIELNGETIEAIGFDMDYTLAQVVEISND